MTNNDIDSQGSLTPVGADEHHKRLIEGDLNFLLDREIRHGAIAQNASAALQVRKGYGCGCNSTNHSSTNKSPLAAYGDCHSYEYHGGVTPSKRGSTISQRSSFDDSLNINEIMISSYGAQEMRVEVSPGKIGDGLFPPMMVNAT